MTGISIFEEEYAFYKVKANGRRELIDRSKFRSENGYDQTARKARLHRSWLESELDCEIEMDLKTYDIFVVDAKAYQNKEY